MPGQPLFTLAFYFYTTLLGSAQALVYCVESSWRAGHKSRRGGRERLPVTTELCPDPSDWPEQAREQEEHLCAGQRHPEADAQTGAAQIALQIVLQDVEKFHLGTEPR